METASIITDYATDPINNFVLDKYTVKYSVWNEICGDGITIYLLIDKNNNIEDYSFSWFPAMVATASASMIAEQIVWKSLDTVLKWDFDFMKSLWLEVSPRRKRAVVLPLVAVRNAIHVYLKDEKKDDFDDLIKEY